MCIRDRFRLVHDRHLLLSAQRKHVFNIFCCFKDQHLNNGKRVIISQFTLPSALPVINIWITMNNWTRRYLKEEFCKTLTNIFIAYNFQCENWFFLWSWETSKRECVQRGKKRCFCLVIQPPSYGKDIVDSA